jgi:RHS repeat-associated protein
VVYATQGEGAEPKCQLDGSGGEMGVRIGLRWGVGQSRGRGCLLLVAAVAITSLTPNPGHAAVGQRDPLASSNSQPAQVGPAAVALAPATEVVRFEFTGGSQSWPVPAGVTSIGVEVEGAQGGGLYGGFGGRTKATLSVEPGEQLQINVGGGGSEGTGGFNGGGGGGFGGGGFGGGGASDIRVSPYEFDDRVVVAGGGGSAAPDATSIFGVGGSGGREGEAGGDGAGRHKGGGGGTQTGGGAAGGDWADEGRLGQGARGGYRAGAGGGGYYGGGSGGSDSTGGSGGGGGGGSSFVITGARDATFLKGVRAGHGTVTITYPGSGSEPVDPVRGVERFRFTGGPQVWRVPAGVTSIRIDAAGAQGGGTYGGFGARVQATVAVTPGQLLTVLVGGQSSSSDGGFNGGGNDGFGGQYFGGGGASDVRVGGWRLDDRVVVAGGGGGAASDATSIFGMGGSAGRLGEAGGDGSDRHHGGGGGTQDAGGAAGGDWASAGRLGQGADGGYSAGAGGGGHYGGGGGGSDSTGGGAGGGGGGSSYAAPMATSPIFTKGYGLGHGSVTIAYPPDAADSDPPDSSAAKTFEYTGGPQLYRVPTGVSAIQVDVKGGQGGNGGGKGGRTQAILPVAPGQLMAVLVGGRGVEETAGFNGGGPRGFWRGVAGGGASDLRLAGWRLEDRIVVAGGGGGSPHGEHAGSGGGGGGLSGAAGGDGDDRWGGGGGGTQTAGGPPGGDWGGEGRLGLGGSGGYIAGAGGGGYYGGGGGGSGSTGGSPGGGGGGSGFVTPKATDSLQETGEHDGDGTVTISTMITGLTPSPNLGPSMSPTEKLGGSNPAENGRTCSAGDPVDTSTGNFWETFTDLRLPSNVGVPLTISRTYNSLRAGVDSAIGYGWTSDLFASLSFDADGVVTVHQENGSQVSFRPAADGYAAPSRMLATLTKHDDGSFTFIRRAADHFDFDSTGRLTARYNRTGDPASGYGVTRYAYDSDGRLVSVTDSVGRVVRLAYDPDGMHLHTLTDSADRTVTFNHDTQGNLVSVVAADGAQTSFTYDDQHRLLTVLNPREQAAATKHPLTNHYDAEGRVDEQTDELGRVTRFAYTNAATTVTDPAGHVTRCTYADGVQASLVRGVGTPQQTTTSYEHDPATLGITAITVNAPDDPNDHQITTSYDAQGNVVSIVDGEGRKTTYTHNSFGQVTTITAPNPSSTGPAGVTTTYTYDPRGILQAEHMPLHTAKATIDLVTTYQHADPARPDLVTAVVDPLGQVTRLFYDQRGQLTRQTSPGGRTTTYTYDEAGRITSVVGPKGNVVGANPDRFKKTLTYDPADRIVSTRTANGSTPVTVRHRYDADGNLARTVDPLGHVTRYRYDLAGQQTTVIRPDGTRLRSDYWPDGALKSSIDAAGHATTFTQDALGRIASVVDPLQRITRYTYDGADNPVSVSNPEGQVTRTRYDNSGRQTLITYSDGQTPDVSITYNMAGMRTSMTDGTGRSTWTYDTLGRLTRAKNKTGTVGYTYDRLGRVNRLKYPSGKTVTRSYAADGELTAVTDWAGRKTTFAYDANGQLVNATAPNGVTTAATVDDAGRINAIAYTKGTTVLGRLTYQRDTAGKLTRETPRGLTKRTQTYGYNRLSQLVRNNAGAFTYDKADNITSLPRATLTYDSANQLTTFASGGQTTAYQYDPRGNRTNSSGAQDGSYSYDQANRLASYRSGATSATYSYNGDGLRISKTVGGVTTPFAYDTAQELPLLLTEGDTSYIYGPSGTPIERISGDGIPTYLHADQLGSIRLLTDANGRISGQVSYTPYGRATATGDSSPFRYAGQYTDTESGLIWMRARYYDPASGQFLTRDPLLAVSREPYGYVYGNPINNTDPTGLWCALGENPNGSCRGSGAAKAVTDHVAGSMSGCIVVYCGSISIQYDWDTKTTRTVTSHGPGFALGASAGVAYTSAPVWEWKDDSICASGVVKYGIGGCTDGEHFMIGPSVGALAGVWWSHTQDVSTIDEFFLAACTYEGYGE